MDNRKQEIEKYQKELGVAIEQIREIALKYPELYDILQICKDLKGNR